MDIVQKIGIHNRFDIEVTDAKTGEIKQRAQAENVVLNRLWDILLNTWSSEPYFSYIYYGSGTGTPAPTDTGLFNYVNKVGASGASYSQNWNSGIASVRRYITLNESTSVGVSISEVGIGNPDYLCTHAMLQDMNGNPISILKTNTDIITIYATVYCQFYDYNKSVTLYLDRMYGDLTYYIYGGFRGYCLGTYKSSNFWSTNYRDRVIPVNVRTLKEQNTVVYQARFAETLYNSWSYNRASNVSSDVSNKRITINTFRIPVGEANMGGIGGFKLSGEYDDWSGAKNAGIVLPVSEFYAGDNITNEAVGTGDGTTTNFATKFDMPDNATVYVNGVAQTSGVTVLPKPRSGIHLLAYIKYIIKESIHNGHYQEHYRNFSSDEYNNGNNRVPLFSGYAMYNGAYGLGFSSIANSGDSTISGSNDLINWTVVAAPNAGTITFTGNEGHFKYYKNDGSGGATLYWNSNDNKNIIFDVAPASGDAITIDYHTPYIAKDSDHVLDINFVIQFGDYTPTP